MRRCAIPDHRGAVPSAVKRILEQQFFDFVPTRSLDEAKTWLASEMNSWRKIVQEMKIEAK